MILSGKEIINGINNGDIIISPFDSTKVTPNSYNLTLNNKLLVYADSVVSKYVQGEFTPQPFLENPLDMKKDNPYKEIIIPDEGIVLQPGIVYLGKTNEFTATDKYVPMLEGRSSIGRLGIHIHVTAGFGDIGFKGTWTLEIVATQPVKIYPNVEICQIYYHTLYGDDSIKYISGKYQGQTDIRTSQLFKEFE